jgi:uncharacterized protein (TIGR02145 family)
MLVRLGWGLCFGLAAATAACGSDDANRGAMPNVSGGSGGQSGAGTGGANAGGEAGAGGDNQTEPPLQLGLATPPVTGMFTDARDGASYRWVELNGKRWMAENLRFEPSPSVQVSCYFDIDTLSEVCDKYGFFYGWSTAHAQALVVTYLEVQLGAGTFRGICPEGWHLPTRQEWLELLDYVRDLANLGGPTDVLGMLTYRGIAEPFRATTEWEEGNGTNELLFDLKPYTDQTLGRSASFWGSDEYNKASGHIVKFQAKDVHVDVEFKDPHHALRCLAGEATAEFPSVTFPPPSNTQGTVTDSRDGKIYATTQIGTQRWMAENLNYEPPTGSACYAHQADHCRLFGRLYDFTTAQTVCPSGWHLPTVTEWQTLASYVDAQTEQLGSTQNGDFTSWQVAKQLINQVLWQVALEVDPPFGFNALPGGFMLGSGSGFTREAQFWSASTDKEVVALVNTKYLTIMPVIEGVQSSVRCLQN